MIDVTHDSPPRKPIPKRLRFEVLRRDNHACRYCGAAAPDVQLVVDHVVPVVLGGTNEPSNLVTACRDCNTGKSSSAPDSALVADVQQDALRWARAMSWATELQLEDGQRINDSIDLMDDEWSKWTYGDGRSGDRKGVPRPLDWDVSVRTWLARGLVDGDLERIVDITMKARHVAHGEKWRYACGVAWNMITDRERLATSLLAATEVILPNDGLV